MNDVFCLAHGRLPHRGPSAFNTIEDLREAYEANRERLLSIRGLDDAFGGNSYLNAPGTRCRAFWRFEAKERPKQIGWRTIRWKIWQLTDWLRERGAEVGKPKERRKVFELQEDVLRRLGEIGPEEEALLDRIKQEEAEHVRANLGEAASDDAGAWPGDSRRCRCRVCGTHRTYPARLEKFLAPRATNNIDPLKKEDLS